MELLADSQTCYEFIAVHDSALLLTPIAHFTLTHMAAQGLSDRHNFNAVVVPHLPEDWKALLNKNNQSAGWTSSRPRAVDPTRHTYFGQSLFRRSLFDFHRLCELGPESMNSVEIDPNVGWAWISSEAEIDHRGVLHRVTDDENQGGTYTYYPRAKGPADDFVTMQFHNAEEKLHHGNTFAAKSLLVFEFRQGLLKHICSPSFREPHLWSGYRALRFHTDQAKRLSQTCRRFETEVKAGHLLYNILLFHDSVQLDRYLDLVTPTSTLLKTLPWQMKHVIIDIRTADPDTAYLRELKDTTVVPLSNHAFPGPRTERPAWDGFENQPVQTPERFYHHANELDISSLSKEQQKKVKERIEAEQEDERAWAEEIRLGIFNPNRSNRLHDHVTRVKAHTPARLIAPSTALLMPALPSLCSVAPPTTIRDLMNDKKQFGFIKREAWISVLTRLFAKYNVRRLDIIYDTNSHDWVRDRPSGMLVTESLSTTFRVKTFSNASSVGDETSTLDDVRCFVSQMY